MGKKITVSLSIILICTFSFINGYTCVYPSFADSNTDQWTSVTTNEELSEAFRYYCKSRNLTINGSVLGSATAFTTQTFNNICNTIGIDMTALQANIKKSTDNNGGLQFLFNTSGITAYNRIFAELLQNNNLSVGDTVDDEIVYSNMFYNNCFVYKVTGTGQGRNKIAEYGTAYNGLTGDVIYKTAPSTFTVDPFNKNEPITFTSQNVTASSYLYKTNILYNNTSYVIRNYHTNDQFLQQLGNVGYYIVQNYPSNLHFGVITKGYQLNNTVYNDYIGNLVSYSGGASDAVNANIIFTTNNLQINNNTYNDNRQTVINEQGDVNNYDYDNEDPPVNPPPSTSTPPTNTGGTDGDISFPDFDFQLPQINWSLGDLSEKFPFSIPFDLIAFFTVLNAEPQAPSIDANIPLGSWYTWHFQADFSQFNNWATIIRNVEFIAFCIGLIYLTIRLVKG